MRAPDQTKLTPENQKPNNSTTTIVSPLQGQICSIAAQIFRQNHSPVHQWNALAGLLFVKCLMQLREDSVDHRIVVLFSRQKIAQAAFRQIQNNNQVSGKCHFLCRKLFCYFSLIQSCQNKLKRELRQILTNTSHTKLDINAFPRPKINHIWSGGVAKLPPCHVFTYVCATTRTIALKKTWLFLVMSLEKVSALFTP